MVRRGRGGKGRWWDLISLASLTTCVLIYSNDIVQSTLIQFVHMWVFITVSNLVHLDLGGGKWWKVMGYIEGSTFLIDSFYLFIYLFIYLLRGREWEREGKKYQCVVASHPPHTGDLTTNPGMHPDWNLTGYPFVHRLALSIHWATPARASDQFFKNFSNNYN